MLYFLNALIIVNAQACDYIYIQNTISLTEFRRARFKFLISSLARTKWLFNIQKYFFFRILEYILEYLPEKSIWI